MSSSRVLLRPVAGDDLAVFFEHRQDRAARHMAAFDAKEPPDRAAFDAHWRRLLTGAGIVNRTIVADGRVAGCVTSWVEDGVPEVTYWLGREHWGKGVATAALAAFLRDWLPARPVRARAAADNAGSIRVLEKCGFRVAERMRGFAGVRGEEIDEVLLLLE